MKWNPEPVIIDGKYVAMPIKNAFNDKTAYWLSKRNCTVSIYMFTVEGCLNRDDLQNRLTQEGVRPYKEMLERRLI